MEVGGHQATLPDFDLCRPTPLQTEPPTYLTTNDPPDTHPTLLFEPPLDTPAKPPVPATEPPGEQATLARYCDDCCPVCHAIEPNVAEHLLLEHADVVNERLEELASDPEPTVPEPDDGQPAADPEPAAFKDAPTDRAGQRVAGFGDHRACDDCGERLSASYARIFATEQGRLYCPDCRSRSERYSNAGGTFDGTDPATVTGTSNPNSSARADYTRPAPEG